MAPVRRFAAMLGSPALSFLRPPSGRRRGRPEGGNRDLMRVDDLRVLSLFDGLTDEQLAESAQAGTEIRIEPGVDLFREGGPADFWWTLIDGAIDLVRHVGREDVVVG